MNKRKIAFGKIYFMSNTKLTVNTFDKWLVYNIGYSINLIVTNRRNFIWKPWGEWQQADWFSDSGCRLTTFFGWCWKFLKRNTSSAWDFDWDFLEIFPSAVSEEGVHHVRLVAEDGHDVGNGLDPNVINWLSY